MKHADEETLALMALGEAAPSTADEHLRQCERCRQELVRLRHVVATTRAPVVRDDELLEPPADLWDDIADELGLGSRPGAAHRDTARADGGEEVPPQPSSQPTQTTTRVMRPPEDGGGATTAPPVPRPRRLSRFAVMLTACAALLGAAAGAGITWWAGDDTAVTAPATQGARLDSLQAGSVGYARLTGGDSGRTLDITVQGLPQTSGYFEVWLMDRSHTKLISMGVLGPDGHAALPVPDNVDLTEYSVVDVSVQPYNGKPDHSGDSLVRGPYRL
ncbi:anti-sigma factor [Streptomyces sp. NPDC001595]|uniref:anti-sigma factor n=1 Tax=Streptomyces sp. NPDC001532 TaxID=3154520 RepID=UPI003328145B